MRLKSNITLIVAERNAGLKPLIVNLGFLNNLIELYKGGRIRDVLNMIPENSSQKACIYFFFFDFLILLDIYAVDCFNTFNQSNHT